MFDEYIGKECEVIVVFGGYAGNSPPSRIKGILESCNKDFITLKTKKGVSIILIKTILRLNVTD